MISARVRSMIDNCANYEDIKKQFHPEPNVKNHLGQVTTLAIEAGDTWDVMMACLLHDIAKNKHCRLAWSQHAYRGSLMIADEVPSKVGWLVKNHMKPYDYTSGKMRAHKRKALEEHEWFDELMRLNNYDHSGRREDGKHMPWDEIYKTIDSLDPRQNKVILMIGVQASGKSTMSRAIVDESRHHNDWHKPLYERTSRDDIREVLGIGPGQWRHQESSCVNVQRQHVRMALGRGQGVVVDNCHNTIKRRRDMIEWTRQEFPGISIKAHLTYAPLDVCIKRNREEHGKPHRHRLLIPDKVLTQFHGDMIAGLGKITNQDCVREKLMNEGFDDVEITITD